MTDATTNAGPQSEKRSAAWRLARRVLVIAIGLPVTILGLALLVAPGPGTPILIAGLAILATEFQWAQRHMDRLRAMARHVLHRSGDTPSHD